MRAFERQPEESAKAYAAFSVYRDLAPERSLVKAAEAYYGSTANLAQLKVWSSRFDWVERVRAYDDWQEMISRQAVENHLQAKAEDHGRREADLWDKSLQVREAAMEQALKMAQWPLTEQRAVNEDGEVTYIFMPTKWNKGTVATMFSVATGKVAQRNPLDEGGDEEMFENLSDEEMARLIEIVEKTGTRPDYRK